MADLEPDWSRYEGPGNLHLLEQPCAFSRELAALVQLFNQNIALARTQNDIVEAERHLEMRHLLIARRRLEAALQLLALLQEAEISSHRIRGLENRAASLAKELGETPDLPARGSSGKQRRRRKRLPRPQQPADAM